MNLSKICMTFMSLILCGSAIRSSASEISGSVTDSLSGRAISGATVVLSKFGPSGKWDWKTTIEATTTTDAAGKYVFTNLSATGEWESYSVEVTKAGYLKGGNNGTALLENETKIVDVRLRPVGASVNTFSRLRSNSSITLQYRDGETICHIEVNEPGYLQLFRLNGESGYWSRLNRGVNRIYLPRESRGPAVIAVMGSDEKIIGSKKVILSH